MVIYLVSFQLKQIVDIYKVPSDLFWFLVKGLSKLIYSDYLIYATMRVQLNHTIP